MVLKLNMWEATCNLTPVPQASGTTHSYSNSSIFSISSSSTNRVSLKDKATAARQTWCNRCTTLTRSKSSTMPRNSSNSLLISATIRLGASICSRRCCHQRL